MAIDAVRIKATSYLSLTRPTLCFVAMLFALEGNWMTIHKFELHNLRAILVALTVGLSIAFANAHNDLSDLETDKLNKPQRPLPSGEISPHEARKLVYLLLFLSIVTSLLAGYQMFFTTTFALIGSYLYNIQLKKVPLVGNLLVAILCSFAVVPGFIVTKQGDFPAVAFLSSFFLFCQENF